MDAAHQDHLARILENRRRRGVTAAGGLTPHSRSQAPVEGVLEADELEETNSGIRRQNARNDAPPTTFVDEATSPVASPLLQKQHHLAVAGGGDGGGSIPSAGVAAAAVPPGQHAAASPTASQGEGGRTSGGLRNDKAAYISDTPVRTPSLDSSSSVIDNLHNTRRGGGGDERGHHHHQRGDGGGGNYITTTTSVVSRNEITLLLESQRQLQFLQALQEKKVDSLSENLERNFSNLQSVMALNGMASASLAPSSQLRRNMSLSPTNGRLHPAGATSTASVGLNSSPPSGTNAHATGQYPPSSSAYHTNVSPTGSRQLVPVNPRAAAARGVATTADRFVPDHGVPKVARPQPKTTLDPKSSISIMRGGDWFLKWNTKWTRAEARYVWLDITRYELLWGRERLAKNIFSDAIELESISSVTTDQITEFDGDVNRLFYLLRIYTNQRSLVLATEKREKLDCWYEAISTVVLYTKGQRMARTGAVSSD